MRKVERSKKEGSFLKTIIYLSVMRLLDGTQYGSMGGGVAEGDRNMIPAGLGYWIQWESWFGASDRHF